MTGLQLQHIQSGYGEKMILKDLTLAIESDRTFVLMGPSGSGKSTLLLTILGIIPATKGKVILNGRDITHLPIELHGIGYLPQDYGLFPHLTVLKNVSYGLRVRGVAKHERNSIAADMLMLVDLQGFEQKKIQELSGGQRQRVALARALAVKPELLLLDEPLSNIDQATKLDVATQLKALFKKLHIPVLLVTHNHEDALFLTEHLAIMIDGKIEQSGTLTDVMQHPKSPFIQRLLMPFANLNESE